MFKRLTSKRRPGVTLLRELEKEFRPQLGLFRTAALRILGRFPRAACISMLVLMLASAFFSFIQVSPAPGHALPAEKARAGAAWQHGWLPGLWQTTSALKKTLILRAVIDSLSARKNPDRRDSIALEQALDTLQQLTQSLKKHEDRP